MMGPFGFAQIVDESEQQPELGEESAPPPPPTAPTGPDPTAGEDFKEFSCQQKADGYLCAPSTPVATVIFMSVQDAINRAAVKVGISENVPLTGNIGPVTAQAAMRTLLASPLTDRVRAWLADSNSMKDANLAAGLASVPMFAIATFDEVSGFQRPMPLSDPRKLPAVTPTVPATTTPPATAAVPTPAPTPAAPGPVVPAKPTTKPGFWTTRNIILIAVGVLAAGAVTYYFVRRKRAAPASNTALVPAA